MTLSLSTIIKFYIACSLIALISFGMGSLLLSINSTITSVLAWLFVIPFVISFLPLLITLKVMIIPLTWIVLIAIWLIKY
jgi:hypothetical protein